MLKNLTLECSLKPFIESRPDLVCQTIYRQWAPLIAQSDQVSVLLWAADGSEILDYAGDLDDEIEWASWIGGANPRAEVPGDPDRLSLHSRCSPYRDVVRGHTYRSLAGIVEALRRVGQSLTGRTVRIGATFDPGPEFAKSSFKYERHPEICLAGTMGRASFVCAYATLAGDDRPYAGYPHGIPEGTSVGTFLGRQSQRFLGDLGYDYLWLSNGFGFGLETWASRGATFDGETFKPELTAELRDRQLGFWRDFRAECPRYPVEVRGTNLTTGIDLASDAVPLDDIYRGGFGLLPPPNSPWAALNGDFGFELVGYLSHIAELPGDSYPFRFYVHDPWWLNSPWLDRYGRQPHDIYLPLSVARLDEGGRVTEPGSLALLTVDNSLGELPEQVPEECQPHLLEALRCLPDEAGPLVWLYPWEEYHTWTFGQSARLPEVFGGDWMVRRMVNAGLPLNTVISSRAWPKLADSDLWRSRLLVSLAPDAGTAVSDALLAHVASGGELLLYGSLARADQRWLNQLGLQLAGPLEGEFEVSMAPGGIDTREAGPPGSKLVHRAVLGGGPLVEAPAGDHRPRAVAVQGDQRRVLAAREGTVAWVRGADSQRFPAGAHLMSYAHGAEWCQPGPWARDLLAELGWVIGFDRVTADQDLPLCCWSRHDNAWYLAAYCPDTTVATRLRLPWGAPLPIGAEVRLRDGQAQLHLGRAARFECRCLVEQVAGVVSCIEQPSVGIDVTRRLLLRGLQEATVRIYPPAGYADGVTCLVEPRYPYLQGDFRIARREAAGGPALTLDGVSGDLLLSW